MDEKETLVAEDVTEDVEQTTEQTQEQAQIQTQEPVTEKPVKTYTQEEVDAVVGKRLARQDAKLRREYDRKYSGLTEVLRAGTGKEDIGEITDELKNFYASRGVTIRQNQSYSPQDAEILARADAESIIAGGYEEVVEEVDRLMGLGTENMSPREKSLFRTLAEHRRKAEQVQELSQIGVTEDVFGSKAFQDFAAKFSATTPIREIYDIYQQTQPKKNYQTMGSMKQAPGKAVKDFYTEEEISRLSDEELDDPKVWEAVRRSMTGGA